MFSKKSPTQVALAAAEANHRAARTTLERISQMTADAVQSEQKAAQAVQAAPFDAVDLDALLAARRAAADKVAEFNSRRATAARAVQDAQAAMDDASEAHAVAQRAAVLAECEEIEAEMTAECLKLARTLPAMLARLQKLHAPYALEPRTGEHPWRDAKLGEELRTAMILPEMQKLTSRMAVLARNGNEESALQLASGNESAWQQ